MSRRLAALAESRLAVGSSASTSGGRVTIDCRATDEGVLIEVADTGVGIPESVKSRIFEAFFTTKQMGEGMGLGLSITNEIVEDYGGTIRIGSGIHGGTAFVLTFPAAG